MRILNAILCVMMLLFIFVQFNDSDGSKWALYYSVPAIWTALAALRLKKLGSPIVVPLLGVSILAALALVAVYWPRTPGFWKQDVWWETETAREGMGIMIATIVLLIATVTIIRSRKTQTQLTGETDV